MKNEQPLWISEAEVVQMMNLGEAIDALEAGLKLEAAGQAQNMSKTHVSWDSSNTLHAIGAAYEGANVVGTKSWAHTEGGATPLLVMWDAHSGALLAIIEAFALGQMRTGAMSGVATRWMSHPNADVFALIGTGKQALAQLAAVAAVRQLRSVRVWGRDQEKRRNFISTAEKLGHEFSISAPATVSEATRDASLVTLVTRAREPFFTSAMAIRGAHINAVGAITPEREEFTQDVLTRAGVIATDDPAAARKLSREFSLHFSDAAGWARVRPISALIAAGRGRPDGCDLSVFKAMGMGISDLALGIEINRRARAAGAGRPFDAPRKALPRLSAANAKGEA